MTPYFPRSLEFDAMLSLVLYGVDLHFFNNSTILSMLGSSASRSVFAVVSSVLAIKFARMFLSALR